MSTKEDVYVAVRAPRVLSLCSGIGGLDLGIKQATGDAARTVCYIEREAFCADVLAARMGQGLDDAPIWSDLKSFDGRPWRGQVDCIVGGYPCFRGDMLVLTRDGYREISSLRLGDEVLTHKGRWRAITAVMRKQGAQLRTIRAQGTTDIVTTDEHPFYARALGRRWNNERRRHLRIWAEPRWVQASDVAFTDYLGQILPPVVEQKGSYDYWWLVGRYLADGWRFARPDRTRKDGTPMANIGGRVIICSGHHEADELAERIAKAGFSAFKDTTRTGAKFNITNSAFFRFLEPFGKYAHGKTLPGFALALDPERSRALLEGYISGDGWTGPNGDRYITTVSKKLALGACLLAQRAYGVVASIRTHNSKRVCVIEGRTVNERPQHRVHIPTRNRSAFVEGDYGWKRPRKNEKSGTGEVYNIAVDEDESYVVNGAIVHNCQPFSTAGRRLGAEDPRHLWPHIVRIIETVEPAACFFENVPGHLTLGFEQVCQDLQGLGYSVEAGIFSAAECGAFHLRKRLFFFAYADRVSVRHAKKPARDQDGQNALQPDKHGPQQFVADPAGARCAEGLCGTCDASERQGRLPQPQRLGADVADAECKGKRFIPASLATHGKEVCRKRREQTATSVSSCENVADANDHDGRLQCAGGQHVGGQNDGLQSAGAHSVGGPAHGGAPVAHADCKRQLQPGGSVQQEWRRPGDSGARGPACGCAEGAAVGGLGRAVAGAALALDEQHPWGEDWEDGVPRVATGQPFRADRLRALGNAVVPQTAALAWSTLGQKVLDAVFGHG